MFILANNMASSVGLEIPESFTHLGSTLGDFIPAISLLFGALIGLLFFCFAESRNQKAWSFLVGILGVLLLLPILANLDTDRYAVSGMVVNSIPNEEGAVIGLDSSGREMIQLNNGPLPYLGDSVDLSCQLDGQGNSRVFHCDLVELRETNQGWMDQQ